jgi:outer membrane protein OmpA-like peptidoglycan-associated protein
MRPARAATILFGFSAFAATVAAYACGPQRVELTPTPQGRALFVLLPDPADGSVGTVSVSNQSGTVELNRRLEATSVATDAPPTPPALMDEAEVQRLFGDVLSALPPPPMHFVLYFRIGLEELTEESRRLVPDIQLAVRNRPVPNAIVVGHTDTTGSSRTNYALGLKRAALARELLVAGGVDMRLIEIDSHGEADLLIPTPDETDEPRNRRVEIQVQ